MAKETALEFIHVMKDDPSIRMKLRELRPDDIDGVVDYATLNGYVFSREDYLAAVRDYEQREVAGGVGNLSNLPGFNHN